MGEILERLRKQQHRGQMFDEFVGAALNDKAVEALERALGKSDNNLAAAQKRCESLEETIREKGGEIGSLKSELATSRKETADCRKDVEKANAACQKECDRAEKISGALTSAKEEIAALRASVAALQAENKELRKKPRVIKERVIEKGASSKSPAVMPEFIIENPVYRENRIQSVTVRARKVN